MDINTEAAERLLNEIGKPENLLFTEGNTRNREDIRKAVEATVKKFGAIDSVAANAGIPERVRERTARAPAHV